MQHEDDGVEGWMCKNFNSSGPYVTVKKEGRKKQAMRKLLNLSQSDVAASVSGQMGQTVHTFHTDPDSLSEARFVYR